MSDRVKFNCRMPATVYEELAQCAEDHGVSMNALAMLALREYLRQPVDDQLPEPRESIV